jgi:hypothetical protein
MVDLVWQVRAQLAAGGKQQRQGSETVTSQHQQVPNMTLTAAPLAMQTGAACRVAKAGWRTAVGPSGECNLLNYHSVTGEGATH